METWSTQQAFEGFWVIEVGWIMTLCPPRCPHPNLWNLWIWYLIWQKDFAEMIKLRILEMEKKIYWISGLFENEIQCNYEGPYKREEGGGGLPWGPDGWECPTCQCRALGLGPWPQKIPHAIANKPMPHNYRHRPRAYRYRYWALAFYPMEHRLRWPVPWKQKKSLQRSQRAATE